LEKLAKLNEAVPIVISLKMLKSSLFFRTKVGKKSLCPQLGVHI
jgi:hypothetical protein